MELNPLHFVVGNVFEHRIGEVSHGQHGWADIQIPRAIAERAEFFRENYLCIRLATHLLEGEPADAKIRGVWPINYFRCERRIGNPGTDVFPDRTPLSELSSKVRAEAFKHRILCYRRVANAAEAKTALRSLRGGVRYATEITSHWYDPPDGIITVDEANPEILGTHAVPIAGIAKLEGQDRFYFPNSWGQAWGADGLGAITIGHFDRFLVECWDDVWGSPVPFDATDGTICLGWTWSLNQFASFHCREILNASTNERLAWAFCCRRDDYLDVEEFFVWPDDRGKGFGHELARMVLRLAKALNLPLRLLVSYADTEPYNEANLNAAAKLLGVELADSGEKWVHMFGTKLPVHGVPIRKRPRKPANVLEKLCPRDERPAETSVDQVVFFGTTRKLVDSDDVSQGFSSDRDNRVHLGRTSVRILKTPKFGSHGLFWLDGMADLLRIQPQLKKTELFADEVAFGRTIADIPHIWDSEPHHLLFVHGYNTTFPEAVKRAGRLGVDLKIRGKTFCYSWPSRGKRRHYFADEASVDVNVQYLREFIQTVLRQTGDDRVSIIGHSMGNRLVIRSLNAIAEKDESLLRSRLRQLIFAAPDVDADEFKQVLPQLLPIPDRTTLYASRGDVPLFVSSLLHGHHRAGLSHKVTTVPNLDTVMVEGFKLRNLGHDYFAEARPLIVDMHLLMHYGEEPDHRPTVVRTTTAMGSPYWKLSLS